MSVDQLLHYFYTCDIPLKLFQYKAYFRRIDTSNKFIYVPNYRIIYYENIKQLLESRTINMSMFNLLSIVLNMQRCRNILIEQKTQNVLFQHSDMRTTHAVIILNIDKALDHYEKKTPVYEKNTLAFALFALWVFWRIMKHI